VAVVQQSFGSAGVTEKSAVENLGALVIQVARDGLQFIEALLLPEHVRLAIGGQLVPVGAFRSAQSSAQTVALLNIQQSIRELDLSLSLLQDDNDAVLLKVRLTKQGQPLVRQRVSLASAGRLLYSSNTSASGEVEFSRLGPGAYTVRIPQEHVETQLTLRAS
jgi:hypothetical protein